MRLALSLKGRQPIVLIGLGGDVNVTKVTELGFYLEKQDKTQATKISIRDNKYGVLSLGKDTQSGDVAC